MPPLTRPRRQWIFTVAMVATTVVPTAVVAAWAWRVNRPGHVRDVEVELGRRLGMKVTLAGVAYPRPGSVVYHGPVAWQEEPRSRGRLVEVARANRIELRTAGRQVVVRAEGLRLRGEGPRAAMARVEALFGRAVDAAANRAALDAPTCVVELGGADGEIPLRYELADLAATYRIEGGSPTVSASFRLDGPDVLNDPEGGRPGNRCELVLTRDRSGDSVATTLAFRTAEGDPLPARVLDPYFAAAGWLGPEARVRGELTLEQRGAQAPWSARFRGELSGVDLSTMVAHFPDHRLAGRATVAIDDARWGERPGGQGPGWLAAEGRLGAGAGSIGAGLLAALRSEMHLRPAAPDRGESAPDPSGEVSFGGLGLAFALTTDGEIRLGGSLGPGHDPAAVLLRADRPSPLALAPDGAASVLGLLRALGPERPGADVLVPIASQTQPLRFLPVPTGRPRAEVGNN